MIRRQVLLTLFCAIGVAGCLGGITGQSDPDAEFEWEYHVLDEQPNALTITHQGGDEIDVHRLTVTVNTDATEGTGHEFSLSDLEDEGGDPQLEDADRFTEGETVRLRGSGIHFDEAAGHTVRLVWMHENGDSVDLGVFDTPDLAESE